MNKKMAKEMQGLNWTSKKLPPNLCNLINAGFCELNDCVFFIALANIDTNVSANDFPDKTGYECFINSIHIDDFVESDYLAYACMFVEACFEVWRKVNCGKIIRAIISSDEFGALVKIHVVRIDESWIGQHLDKYEDAILVADSSLITLRDI